MEQTKIEILVRIRCKSCHQYQTLSSIRPTRCGGCERVIRNGSNVRRYVRMLRHAVKGSPVNFDL